MFVDVRAPHDVEALAFDVPEVFNMPFDQLELRWHELPSHRELVMVCQNGSRSALASQFLRDQGVKNVSPMRGGIQLWMKKGYAVIGKRFTNIEKTDLGFHPLCKQKIIVPNVLAGCAQAKSMTICTHQ